MFSALLPESEAPVFSTYWLPLLPTLQLFSHKENVSHVQWGDANEQGPLLGLLGPDRMGQHSSRVQSTKSKVGVLKGIGDEEIKGVLRWSAGVESFLIACSLCCAISSSV